MPKAYPLCFWELSIFSLWHSLAKTLENKDNFINKPVRAHL